jgi:hypothetical protein
MQNVINLNLVSKSKQNENEIQILTTLLNRKSDLPNQYNIFGKIQEKQSNLDVASAADCHLLIDQLL